MTKPTSLHPSLSRRALLGSTAAAAAAITVGCSPVGSGGDGDLTDQSHSGPISLSFWKPPGLDPKPENAFYDARGGEFTSAHNGDKIDHLIVPWEDALTKFTAAFGGGTAPDISYLILLWLNQFSSAGALAALDDIDPKLDLTGFAAGPLDSAKGKDGKLYGLPYYSSRWCLALNEDVWEAAGSPELPKTYEDLSRFVKELTRDQKGRSPGESGFDKDNIKTYGMTWSGVAGQQVNYLWNYLWAYGADYVAKDAKDIGFNTDGGRQALELMRDLQVTGAATPLTLYSDPDKWGELIMTGRSAVSWMAPPTASIFEKFPKARLKVLDLPSGPAGQFVLGGVGYLSISAKSKYPQTALDFIRVLTTDENVSKYIQKTLVFPVRDSITSSVYDSVTNKRAKDFLTTGLPQGKFLRLTRPIPYSGENYLIGEINNYVNGQKKLDAMLADASKQIGTMARNAGL